MASILFCRILLLDKEEDVGSYWMTLRKKEDTLI
jgi:hypothetical protein